MGIRGLETFFDRIASGPDRAAVYTDTPLSELRLVIDGNQFAYFMSSLFGANQWCGNYDAYGAFLRSVLARLAPSIECVIFDGGKELQAKARRRLEQRCEELSTAVAEEQSHVLQDYPALFNRIVLYEVLAEFNVKVRMCEGLADHIIALYANGYNDCDGGGNKKFTVLSKASFFNIYNLEQGYVCAKHLHPFLLKSKLDPNFDLMSAKIPVFRLSSLMSHFCLDSPLTWIYFCILCGNNDDAELGRNYNYFQHNGVEVSQCDFTHLIAHLKLNEYHLIETNYRQIRSSYPKTALVKIDALIELFEMKNHEYKFLEPMNAGTLTDFDRLFATIRRTLCNYLPCLVEDYASACEASAFEAADEIIRSLYAALMYRCRNEIMNTAINTKLLAPESRVRPTLREYRRTHGPIRLGGQLIEMNFVDLADESALNETRAFRKCYEYLREAEKRHVIGGTSETFDEDDFTLFVVALIYWQKWLATKIDERFKGGSLKISDFQEALFRNLILIAASSSASSSSSEASTKKTTNYSKLVHVLCQDEHTRELLSTSYESLRSSTPKRVDLKLVHSLSELQAIYYYMGALNEIKPLRMKMLSPARLFNSNFLLKFLADRCGSSSSLSLSTSSPLPSDLNNNESDQLVSVSDQETKSLRRLDTLFAESETVKKCMALLDEVYAPCRLETVKIELEEFIKTS